ncbi:MAG: CHASE2 domain-containing protein, partial [Cytophagales bacterium]
LKMFTEFDVISKAFKDFELTDYAFNSLRPDPVVDERFAMVNFGTLSRREVAYLIQAINQYKPRVIALDALYNCEGGLRDSINCPQLLDTLGNLMLSNAIQEAKNVVMGEKLMQSDSLSKFDSNIVDSLEISDPIFSDYAHEGFVTLPTDATYQEDVKIVRSIWPQIVVNGKRELAFSVQIANQYDSNKVKKFLARNKEEEIINFFGNIDVVQLRVKTLKANQTSTTNFGTGFYVVDFDDVLKGNVVPGLFKDKIVIIGYLGNYLGHSAWEDKFFTPLNKKFGGRANPDMFGPVVHANAAAMILNENYVDEIPDWLKFSIAFTFCFLTVALFGWMDAKLPIWYDALSVIIQIIQIISIMILVVLAFAYYNLKLDLSLTLAAAALVGPCYDIFKSVQNEIQNRLTKRRELVSKEQPSGLT